MRQVFRKDVVPMARFFVRNDHWLPGDYTGPVCPGSTLVGPNIMLDVCGVPFRDDSGREYVKFSLDMQNKRFVTASLSDVFMHCVLQ